MPIYEYKCTKCEKHFEKVQKITEPARADCPKCGSAAKRLISASAFALRGGGWYKDGYSSSNSGKKTENSRQSAASSEKTTEVKKEPAPKK